MLLYRVAHPKYKESTLSGIGAEKVGGRWNQVGVRAVYCSESIALALLEYYIHSENLDLLPKKILVAKISVPDKFKIETLKPLPENWNNYPYTYKSAQVFGEKVKKGDFFALKVPSAIVPMEYNYVLNPLYSKFHEVKILEFIDLEIDDRLR